MKLGNTEVTPITQKQQFLSILAWGKPACGKTVLASTMPGKKLWLLFDPNGTASIDSTRDDIVVADFTAYKPSNYQDFKAGGIVEKDLLKGIREEGITSVVVDSLTSYGQNALYYGIASGKANGKGFTASIETPGLTGYGIRTAMILDFASMVMRVCADCGVHVMFITHEMEEHNDKNELTGITFALSGGAKNVLPAKISEIWFVEDTGRERLIYVRNHGMRAPMRTRMFLPSKDVTRFVWRYDQNNPATHAGATIEEWNAKWVASNFAKQPLPT